MTAPVTIGIDIGTTSTKALIFSPELQVKGEASQSYPLQVPQSGWAEQDPAQIFTAVLQAVRRAVEQAQISTPDIAGLSFSAAMHTLILMDRNGQSLTPCLTWADNRSLPQANQLRQQVGLDLYYYTGTPIHPMSPLTKLIWWREERASVFATLAKAISIKEFILYQLFGRYVVDHAMASATGLYNMYQRTWDEQALAWAGIRPDQLSELVPTTTILRGMGMEWAAAMDLDPQTPVVVGSSDGALANLGVGAYGRREAVTIGTSGAIRQIGPDPLTDPQGRTFCYVLSEDLWLIGGASNGGRVLHWFRDQLAIAEVQQAQREERDPFEVMIQLASTIPAGAEGLLCLPFLTGERAPYWNPAARGVFFGMGLNHSRAHFIRAVLEGILYSLYTIALALHSLINPPQELRASGGFAQSTCWCQMLADLFDIPVVVPQIPQASALGAALLGMKALGLRSQLLPDDRIIVMKRRHDPNQELTAIYRHHVEIYQQLYRQLEPIFGR